jgi:hypothetical protein
MSISQDPQMMRIVAQLSGELKCSLDEETLKLIVELLELGIHPNALANLVNNVREDKARKEAKEKRLNNVE